MALGTCLMRAVFAALVLAALAAAPARAQDDAAARAARWQELRQAVFGERPLQDGAGLIALEAPDRAADAALVPVTVTLSTARGIAAVWLLVDGNPSPLAGTFRFGPAADPRIIRTRLRVDQYTLVHAVAETSDGQLFVAEHFVKAAGGCSAPSTKDAKLALERLGRMRVRFGAAQADKPVTAQLLVSHPNYNGMQMDQVTRLYTPARFIQDITVRNGDALVFHLDADISLSEDPAITFGFIPQGTAPLTVEVQDSTQAVFRQSFPLESSGS
jgi:sulfur-oxidizing protein SoxY